jgi:hypothetical protein
MLSEVILNGRGILWCYDIRRKWFSSSRHASNHWNVFHISRYSMMYCLTKHRGAMTTFLVLRSSQSEMPTLSRLKTNSATQPCIYSFRFWIVLSRNALGICKRCSSCGVLCVWTTSPECWRTNEFTNPRVSWIWNWVVWLMCLVLYSAESNRWFAVHDFDRGRHAFLGVRARAIGPRGLTGHGFVDTRMLSPVH